MRKDTTTFTRYFFMLLIVFVLWLIMMHRISKTPEFADFFGLQRDTLSIIKII